MSIALISAMQLTTLTIFKAVSGWLDSLYPGKFSKADAMKPGKTWNKLMAF